MLSKTHKNFDTGRMTDKIMATANYHSGVIEKIHTGRAKKDIAMAGAKIIDASFGLWMDNKARRDPEKYHHVYEWGMAGDKNSRLFDCETTYRSDPVISFKLIESKRPNENGYIFSQKAMVMEFGDPVVIEPVEAEVLVFEIEDNVIFHPGPITVENPGGNEVSGSFYQAFTEYMAGEAEASIVAMNFAPTILKTIDSESNRVLSKMSGNNVISAEAESSATAERIVNTVEVISNAL